MTRIFLIRHGETEWNRQGKLQGQSNVNLSPEGVHQAQMLAEYAYFKHADAIYSSDLHRAAATAEILAKKFGLRVRKMPELRETNFGEWEGKSISELAEKYPKDFGKFFTAPEKFQPPQGESFLSSQARIINAMDRITANHDNENIIVVSHGAVIRLLLCAALDMPIHKMWALAQFNMAVNVLLIADGNITVELMNGTGHLHSARS